jgi:hypothetical protein
MDGRQGSREKFYGKYADMDIMDVDGRRLVCLVENARDVLALDITATKHDW